MPELTFDVQEARAGSDWLAREGRARQADLLVALLSRFNHDLRTPLNTVVGWTHLLQQGLVDSTRSKHVADVLVRNTREQTVLLDEFVDDGRAVLVNRLKLQGMIVFDWKERYGEALKALGGYYAAGKLKTRESIVEGLANAPQGLVALLKGGNFGKQLVKLA